MDETSSSLVQFENIHKSFGSVCANAGVSFAIAKQSIHGVVGENGAGKSTIMKVLYGLYAPDEGTIYWQETPTKIETPHKAIQMGIGMVHQHFMLVPTLKVWENIILGHEPSFVFKEDQIIDSLNAFQKSFGFELDLRTKTENLPVGHQQQLEILKLLYRKANLLILDEPTAVLTPSEVDVLFERLKQLQAQGKTIVLITHKLKEILRLTEQVTIMRQGRVVNTVATKGLDEKSLAEQIVGRSLQPPSSHRGPAKAQVVLSVKDLSLAGPYERPSLNGISFNVHSGEIVGFAGVEGNGQEELLRVLSSVEKKYTGSVEFLETEAKHTDPYSLKQSGLSVIPSDRLQEGIILNFNVAENFAFGHHRKKELGHPNHFYPSRLKNWVAPLLEKFDVRPRDPGLAIRALSGGNQQKVVVGRELDRPVKLLVAAHPTRGVDIGAIESIHSLFLAQREAGAAIVLISSELEEILELSDRIYTLYEGRITGESKRGAVDECQLGLWMTGGKG